MREFKFRGKCFNGEFVYGDIDTKSREAYDEVVITVDFDNDTYKYDRFEVDPDSVGQFTGCVDVRDSDIYEGDLVRFGVDSQLGVIVFDRGAFLIKPLPPFPLGGVKQPVYLRDIVNDSILVLADHFNHL